MIFSTIWKANRKTQGGPQSTGFSTRRTPTLLPGDSSPMEYPCSCSALTTLQRIGCCLTLSAVFGYKFPPSTLTKHGPSWQTLIRRVLGKATHAQSVAAMIRLLCPTAEKLRSLRSTFSACLCDGKTLVDTARLAVPNGTLEMTPKTARHCYRPASVTLLAAATVAP